MKPLKDILIVVLLTVLVGMTYVQEGDIMVLHERTFRHEGGLHLLNGGLRSLYGGLLGLKGGLDSLKGGLDSLKGGLALPDGGLDSGLYFETGCLIEVEKFVTGPRIIFFGPSPSFSLFGLNLSGADEPRTKISKGSGVFVSDNMILTAKHVVEGRTGLPGMIIRDNAGQVYCVEEVIEDVDDDLALIVIAGRSGPYLELGPLPPLGADLICIGSPLITDRHLIITWGRVSSIKLEKHFLYNGFVWHGQSGGAIIHDGKLVGIVNARLRDCDSLGFAARIDRLDPDLRNRF